MDNPVITILGTAFVSESLTPLAATVKTNGSVVDGIPVKLPDNAAGVLENTPEGNVMVMVSFPANAFVTFNEIVKVLLAHAAVPPIPSTLGIHFFAASFHDVPTSQHPGP